MTEKLKALALAATKGTWTVANVSGAGIEMRVPYKDSTRLTFVEVWRQFPEKEWDAELWANAQYIEAASPDAILALIKRAEDMERKMVDGVTINQYIDLDNEVDRLRTEVERLTEACNKFSEAELLASGAAQKENT